MAERDDLDDATPVEEIKNKLLRRRINDAATEYRALGERVTELQKLQRALMADLKIAARETGHDKIRGEGWLLLKTIRANSKIDPKRLLKKGVSMAVIEFATVSKPTESWSVRGSKEKDENEEEE